MTSFQPTPTGQANSDVTYSCSRPRCLQLLQQIRPEFLKLIVRNHPLLVELREFFEPVRNGSLFCRGPRRSRSGGGMGPCRLLSFKPREDTLSRRGQLLGCTNHNRPWWIRMQCVGVPVGDDGEPNVSAVLGTNEIQPTGQHHGCPATSR